MSWKQESQNQLFRRIIGTGPSLGKQSLRRHVSDEMPESLRQGLATYVGDPHTPKPKPQDPLFSRPPSYFFPTYSRSSIHENLSLKPNARNPKLSPPEQSAFSLRIRWKISCRAAWLTQELNATRWLRPKPSPKVPIDVTLRCMPCHRSWLFASRCRY